MFGVATGRGSMRRVLELFKSLVALLLLGILGLSVWLAFIRPELLPLASAYAAKTVCSNVFIAKRDPDAVIRTDVQFAERRVAELMKIDVDNANRRVEAALLGLFTPHMPRGVVAHWFQKTKSWPAPPRRHCCRSRCLTRFGRPARRHNCPMIVVCGQR
jgi:hypothetical protein